MDAEPPGWMWRWEMHGTSGQEAVRTLPGGSLKFPGDIIGRDLQERWPA